MKKLFLLIVFLFPLGAWAQEVTPETLLIDVPTASTLDKYQASLTTRAYTDGAVMESLDFGVLPQINIGVSVAVYQLLGNSDDIKILNPDFQAKWKVFDGSLYWPAIAIGYDGRRYGYNKHTKKYLDDRKGGFITFTREIFTPGLEATAGINLSDFDRKDIYGFLGVSWTVNEWLTLLGEWDNLHRMNQTRANVGARFAITPTLALSGAVRRIGRGNENERILQLRYVTNF